MEQFGSQNSIGRLIDWQGRDIISLMNDMSIPYDKDNAVLVEVKSMPSDIRKIAEGLVERRACFYNSAMMVSVMFRSDMKYVVGYASAPIPFEHAWIRVGELYYDPTWEICNKSLGSGYLSLCEMSLEELEKIMHAMKTDIPPDLVAMRRFRRMNRSKNA